MAELFAPLAPLLMGLALTASLLTRLPVLLAVALCTALFAGLSLPSSPLDMPALAAWMQNDALWSLAPLIFFVLLMAHAGETARLLDVVGEALGSPGCLVAGAGMLAVLAALAADLAWVLAGLLLGTSLLLGSIAIPHALGQLFQRATRPERLAAALMGVWCVELAWPTGTIQFVFSSLELGCWLPLALLLGGGGKSGRPPNRALLLGLWLATAGGALWVHQEVVGNSSPGPADPSRWLDQLVPGIGCLLALLALWTFIVAHRWRRRDAGAFAPALRRAFAVWYPFLWLVGTVALIYAGWTTASEAFLAAALGLLAGLGLARRLGWALLGRVLGRTLYFHALVLCMTLGFGTVLDHWLVRGGWQPPPQQQPPPASLSERAWPVLPAPPAPV